MGVPPMRHGQDARATEKHTRPHNIGTVGLPSNWSCGKLSGMWIFSRYGFFSAVSARQGDGAHGQPVDPERIMVRARVRGHLEALIEGFPQLVGSAIKTFPATDYAYRIFVSKSVWSQVLAALGGDIDYDNFKSEVARFQGRGGGAYERALHDVWSVMYALQEQRRQ